MGKCLLVCKELGPACGAPCKLALCHLLFFVSVTVHETKGRERPKCNCNTEQVLIPDKSAQPSYLCTGLSLGSPGWGHAK